VEYLTYWVPAAERARAVALFMTGTAIAGVLGGPVSGAILSMHGFAGLSGWQWLFLLEGVPAVILGIAVVFYLTDRPEHAQWLAPEERAWLSARLSQEREETQRQEHYTLKHALTAGRVWVLCVVYFGLVIGLYGFSLWLPQIVKSLSGLNDLGVGVVSAVPYLIAAIGMVLIGQHSDRTGERRWHVAASMFVAAVGLALSAFLETPVIALVLLSVGALGIWGALGPFWTLPTAFLSGTAAAGGIALINSVGNLGGFVGPSVVGFLENATGTFKGGLLALALALLVGGLLALSVGRKAAPTPAGAPGG
jgi:ACS family tartrate transporter-like MFS transporter